MAVHGWSRADRHVEHCDRALPHMWFVSVLFGMAGWVGIAMFLTSFFPKWTEETWDDTDNPEETARYTRSQRAARVIVGVGLWGLCALGALTIGTPLIPVYALAAFIGLFLVVDALHGWYYLEKEAEWEAPKSAPKRAEHDEYLARKWMERGKR